MRNTNHTSRLALEAFVCAAWRLGWGASGLPPLPWNYWWTEVFGVLEVIQNQLKTRIHTMSTGQTTINSSGLLKDSREIKQHLSLPPSRKKR